MEHKTSIRKQVLLIVIALGLVLSMITPFVAYADEGVYSIKYEGKASELVKDGTWNDLFEHFGTMMPGDQATGVLSLQNTTDHPMRAYFWIEDVDTDNGANRKEAYDLFARIKLTISHEGKVLCEGSMADLMMGEPSEGKPVDLGEFAADGKLKTLAYTVSVPSDLTNEFEMSRISQTWVVAAEDVANTNTPTDPSNPPMADTGTKPGTTDPGTNIDGNDTPFGNGKGFAKTGSAMGTIMSGSGFIALVALGVVFAIVERKVAHRRENENTEG